MSEGSLPINEQPPTPTEGSMPTNEQPPIPTEGSLPTNEQPPTPTEGALPINVQSPTPTEGALPINEQPPTPTVVDEITVNIDPQSPSPSQRRQEFVKYAIPLYKATMQGNWEAANQILTESEQWLTKPITGGAERVLDIAILAKHTHFIKELIRLMGVNDLALKNINNQNTALCLAAVSGVVDNAKLLVEKNHELPNDRGSQDMIPLQKAVMLGHEKMAWYLISVTDETQLTDKDRIELVTSAIETDLFDVAMHILGKHPNVAILRNNKKETALHALARKPLKLGGSHHLSIWKRIGCKFAQDTLDQSVQQELVQMLWDEFIKLEEHKLLELIKKPWRLLFAAAECGNTEFLVMLIKSYPDIVWIVDQDKRSIFHIAIINRHEEIFKLIFELGAIKDLISIFKDNKGNNMLHLAGTLPPSHRLNCVPGAALQMQRELLWFSEVTKVVRPEYAKAENNDKKTPHALFSENHEELRKKGEEWMKKTAESCTLVATLIATVVFAAGFTLPGGTESKGYPVLVSHPLFMVFAISNAISLFCSTASILMFLSILTSTYAEQDFLRKLPEKLMVGLTGLFISITTMTVAFTAAFLITFRKNDKWIPMIPIAFLAAIPLIFFSMLQFPLLLEIYRSTYVARSLFEPTRPKLFLQKLS